MEKEYLFNKLNGILKSFFHANAVADNIAYSLDTELTCHQASKYYHEYFAHVFPSDTFADKLSQVMIDNGVRPVRWGIETEEAIYSGIVEAFTVNFNMMKDLKQKIITTIEELDYDAENKVFVVELENILLSAAKYYRVAEIWLEKAIQYGDNLKKFDKDFDDFVDLEND